jgi:Tfp pilus assembly protein PilV
MRKRQRKSQAGISLIELMIAGAILVVCSLGVLSMIIVAIATNTRNRQDSTKTMLAQAVLEQVEATLVGSAETSLTDCKNNVITIDTRVPGSPTHAGADVLGGTVGGNIDFTQAAASVPAGFQATYIVTSPCSATGQYVATYDVRWRVDQVSPQTFLVTVGARQAAAAANTKMQGLFFSTPTNLKQYLGKPQ